MKEICIPLQNISDNESAELNVTVPESSKSWHFRLESVAIPVAKDKDAQLARFKDVEEYIKNYSKDWELLQILDAAPNAEFIRLLYRQVNHSIETH